MREITDYKNKKVLVLGLAKSGLNTARLLHKLGAYVTVNDAKNFDDNPDAQSLVADGIRVISGYHPVELLDEHFELMVKNPGIPYTNPMVVRAQALNIPIITEPELAYEVSEADWIAVTGTNGKTTTTTLIGLILNEDGKTAHVGGNIGIPISQVAADAKASEHVVAELSSFQLMGATKLHPHVAVLTNIYEAHLDYHGSREAYVAAKMRITQNQTADDFFVMNWDLPEMHELAKQSHAQIVPFSRQGAAGARANLIDGQLCFDGQAIMAASDLQIPGDHNIENALAAIAATKLYGASDAAITRVLSTFTGVKHRIQYVQTVAGRRFYNDSKATNVEAASVAINAFSAPEVLIAGGLDRGLPMDELVPLMQKHVKALVTYGETAELMVAAANAAHVPVVQRVETLNDAVPAAYAQSEPGDVILLSPAAASWDQFNTFEERGDLFITLTESIAKEAK